MKKKKKKVYYNPFGYIIDIPYEEYLKKYPPEIYKPDK